MPYDQSSTLKHALCSSPSPLSKGGGEVLERICSKLGGGLDKAIVPVDSSVIPIEGPYTTRSSDLSTMVLRSMDCVNINSEYTTIDSHFSIIDDLKIVNNQENDLYFYHSDHLGSSSFITDADGIVSQHLQYLPYGELFAEQRDNTARYYTPYKFSAKEKDEETGYSYFGARYYMPELSIWSTVDPMTDKQPWQSPYAYCSLNPIGRIDPMGLLDGPGDDPNANYVPDNGAQTLKGVEITARRTIIDKAKSSVHKFVKALTFFDNLLVGSSKYAKEGGVRLTSEFATESNENSTASSGSEEANIDYLLAAISSAAPGAKEYGEGWAKNVPEGLDKASNTTEAVKNTKNSNDTYKKSTPNNNSPENNRPISLRTPIFIVDSFGHNKTGDSMFLYNRNGKQLKMPFERVYSSWLKTWKHRSDR